MANPVHFLYEGIYSQIRPEDLVFKYEDLAHNRASETLVLFSMFVIQGETMDPVRSFSSRDGEPGLSVYYSQVGRSIHEDLEREYLEDNEGHTVCVQYL